MAELVTKGLLGGHSPTHGFYSAAAGLLEEFLSELEARVGVNPLIRIRFDLDGDGVYEVVELDHVLNVGNLDRVLEYETGKGRFGSCSVSLRNHDQRWTDNYEHSLTYFIGTNPKRYHYRPAIIELGFDGFNKANEDGWFPLFRGFIQGKTESAEDRSVSITLIDEWALILQLKLSETIRGDELFAYLPEVDDANVWTRAFFYGRATFLTKEFSNKDNQLMIPCGFNRALSLGQAPYTIYRPLIVNNLANHYSLTEASLYFWGWDKSWHGDTQQWYRLKEGGVVLQPSGDFFLSGLTSASYTFVAADGTEVVKTMDAYFDVSNKEYKPDVRLSSDCVINTSNPAYILFDLLHNIIGIPTEQIDVSSDNYLNWQEKDIDYDNIEFYSIDVAYHYLKGSAIKVGVNTTKGGSALDLIDSLCSVSRAGFFIDRGKAILNSVPIRRIHFVIHQPRLTPPNLKVLQEERIRQPELTRDVLEIYNYINVYNFNYSGGPAFKEVEKATAFDTPSSQTYGVKKLEIGGVPGDVCFMYDSSLYADFLSDHYLLLYREPPLRMSFSTDLIGYNWDLKKLIRILERDHLNLQDDGRGVFEVYGFKFDTRRFSIGFVLQWAGYLINPDGDSSKTWGFWNHFSWDTNAYYW
jgi:hypothetical protein